jgi:G3E family GTPase
LDVTPAAAGSRIPVTVLTGYLGAGKTTLLNRILSGSHGQRWAVIVNEFGEVGIDHELITHSTEELFEMNNGCICCTVRGDLIRTLHTLLQRPGTFDAIVVETTGLADPGPVAQTFFVDPKLRAATRLDSITTLVDARHITARLADSREAVEQIAFADQLVLNKTDLASEAELRAVEHALRRINPLAPIQRAQRSRVPLHQVLGQGGFDLQRITALDPGFLAAAAPMQPAHGQAGHVHDAQCGHGDHDTAHDHVHDSGITSVSLTSTRPMDAAKVQAWLAHLVATQGAQILRAKGIVDVAGDPRRMVFQAVHSVLEGDWQRPWHAGEQRHSRLVFIGRGLDAAALRVGLEGCVVCVGSAIQGG